MAGEKTEKATPKRKQDERKKGNVFFSREAVTVATLVASFGALQATAGGMSKSIKQSIQDFITLGANTDTITPKLLADLMTQCVVLLLKTTMPILLAVCLAAVVATMLQTRFLFSTQSLKFKGERINPLSGFKKMFSLRSLVELLKALIKISALGYVLYRILSDSMPTLPRLMDMTPTAIFSQMIQLISHIIWTVAVLFVALAAADYLYQWWEYEKNLRMTKQEIKDEYKQMEGDPQVKGRQRSLQQERAKRRMMQAVPTADVVIRNPTHFAVALRYDRTKDAAPIVVAKGQDQVALRIVKVAEDSGVYVMENKPLARALYASIEIGQEIPGQFYEPVAQVLAFVYNLKKKDALNEGS